MSLSDGVTTPHELDGNSNQPLTLLTPDSEPVKSPDEIISEKSNRIKEWVKQRLEKLEHQNQRLRDQNRRCHDQLKALTTVAENNRHWRKSLLLSQSVTGAFPVMLDYNRTSDDSGLTSDETSGENQHQTTEATATAAYTTKLPFSNKIHHYIPSTNATFVKNIAPTDLMTQSTSALMKRSPRQGRRPNAFPKTNIHVNPMSVSKAKSVKSSESDSPGSLPSTTDSSPWEIKSINGNSNAESPSVAPVPAPRRVKPVVPLRPIVIERDSLNSYAAEEDDYGKYEEDDDEIFDEVDSPTTVEFSEPRRLPRCGINATLSNKDYVNLKDFVVVKDEPEGAMSHVYSDIIKANTAPTLPRHQPLIQFEAKLFQTAEKCLSIVDEGNSPSTSGESGYLLPQRSSDNRHPSSFTSRESHPDSGLGRCSSERTAPVPDGMVLAHPPEPTPSGRVSSTPSEYAVPPDAASRLGRLRSRHGSPATPPLTVRSSVVNQCEMELSGYLTAMSDNRLRSLKRRFVVLRNAELKFYRTNKQFIRDEPATMVISLRNIKTISKATSKCGNGFEIVLDSPDASTSTHHRYQAETERATEEWYNALSTLLKNITIVDVASRTKPLEAELSGWVTKVKHGHQKRYFAQLVADKLFFYKKPDEKVPLSCLSLRGARISDRHRSTSSDESSAGSGDEQQARGSATGSGSASGIYALGDGSGEYSLCIEVIDADSEYLILRTIENKDRWLYYLRLAARDPSMHGTPFEVLIERLMASNAKNPLLSPLWDDVLLRLPEENQVETLTTMPSELTKKALDMDAAAYLFTTVQIKPMAIQYHVDLAQNLLTSALPCVTMQNELYAQLIRLTSGSLPFDYQAWKLLGLAIPLYLPKTYSLLWLLRNHIERVCRNHPGTVRGRMAEYCSQALANRAKTGDRAEGLSKLEAMTILTRDPMSTTHPYSIPVRLPTGDHQVIEFDGSTEIGQVLGSLCLKLNIRPAMLSGYALYASDPTGDRETDIMLLRGKAKLCDVLTFWERTSKDAHAGRVTADACSMRLQLRQRHYWSNLSNDETPTERLFLSHKLAEEVVAGHLPLSNDLAEELCALYAQMCYGDAPGPNVDDGLMDQILGKFYPKRLLEVVNIRALRYSVSSQWHNNLHGVPLAECVRLVLLVLRKWKFFAAYIKEARMKIDDRRVFVALNENGIHILSDQFDVIRNFEFHRLITYGDFRNDFMLTVSRILPANAHPEESAKERLTFGMDKKAIEQMTIHITEYVRCQQLLWRMRQ